MSADAITYPSHRKQIETVVIDDTSEPSINNNNLEVVEVLSDDDDEVKIVHEYANTGLFEEILQSKSLLAEVIEKCLELENTAAMERVLKQTLLTYYKRANKSYINSPEFDKVLVRTLTNFEKKPNFKYTYIKSLCENLRASHTWKAKKKATLITLATNVSEKYKKKRGRPRKNSDKVDNKKKKTNENVIEIEDQEPEVSEVINLDDDDQSEVIILDETEKENKECEISPCNNTFIVVNQNNTVLVPHKSVEYTEEQVQSTIVMREERIKILHETITKLEESEVNDDSEFSPYIVCETLKKELISHYKELCKLTGSKEKKHKKVHLKVLDGHPPGPTEMLEFFINNRKDGEEFNFPDLVDVVACVERGLVKDGLQWGKVQIMKEASALFLQCGQALQKCRQRREWKDMLYHIKEEPVWDEDDPAVRDPELMAKLELNKQMAVMKERELIDKYALLQDLPTAEANTILNSSKPMDCGEMEGTEQDSVEVLTASNIPHNTNIVNCTTDVPNTTNYNTPESQITVSQTPFSANETPVAVVKPFFIDTCVDSSGFLIVSVNEKNNEEQTVSNDETFAAQETDTEKDSETTATGEIDNEQRVEITEDAISDSENTLDVKTIVYDTFVAEEKLITKKDLIKPASDQSEQSTEENVRINSENTTDSIDNKTNEETTVDAKINNKHSVTENDENKDDGESVKVKIEPTQNIASLLESLGDNYTVSIVDIEDPFLVIEISSDSDTDDDCESNEDTDS